MMKIEEAEDKFGSRILYQTIYEVGFKIAEGMKSHFRITW